MRFGTKIRTAVIGDKIISEKEVIVDRDVAGKYIREEEQKKVGSSGDEVKDMTAYWYSLLQKYINGEVEYIALETDKYDRKARKITRIKIITEKKV